MTLQVPKVIPNDWNRLRVIIDKLKHLRMGTNSSPTLTGLTLSGLTASTLIGANASKALESVTIGTGLDYTRPTLSLSHLGIESLTDPGVDKILFWDDSETACKWLGVGNSIAITTTTIDTIQDIRTSASPTFVGLTLSGITAESTDVDKFLVDSTGVIKYRTGAQVLSDIGGQPLDAGLTSLAGLTYASDSFIKVTATDTYAIRTIAETKTDLSLNLVENTALSTWAGSTNITTLGTITTVGNITIADGGTIGQAAGPLLTFDDTNNYLEVTGCSVGINTSTPVAKLDVNGTVIFGDITTGSNNRTIIDAIGGGRLYQYSSAGVITNMFGAGVANYILGTNFGIGTASPDYLLEVSYNGPWSRLAISAYDNTEASSPYLILRKADGTMAAPALVDDDAVLGTITFDGHDGSGWHTGAKIEARIDGTPSDGTDMPAELTFWTTPEGSATLVERIIIKPDGGVFLFSLKSGANQAGAGAAANELWQDTADNSIKIGV